MGITAGFEMPRKVVADMPPPSNKKICCFCGQGEDNELEYGKFHEYNGIVTHYYCLLLSSNMQQKGEDEEGILGFLPEDINKELKRGRRLVCFYCKKSGATLGCCNTKCKKIFHFPCGLQSGSFHQFFGEFRSYCRNHRPKQKIDARVAEEVKKRDDMICYICYDEVNPHDLVRTIWAPCCKKNAWFHRGCVQQLAMSAGYFFKCPLCNNNTEFQKAMLDQGIFIPSQDASWELVPNAFEELLYRHNRCDADNCLCPKGREHTSSNAKWELTLCRTCGSQGIHMACGQLKWVEPIWECSECISILNKTITSDSESSLPTRNDGQRRRFQGSEISNDDDDLSSDSDISVGTETVGASTSDSTPTKIHNGDSLGRKSPDVPVALRITRRSVIPIPKSPVNTRIPTLKVATKSDVHPPKCKSPENLRPERSRPENLPSERKRTEDPPDERSTPKEIPPERRTPKEIPPERRTPKELPHERKRSEDLPPERKRSENLPPERKISEALPLGRKRSEDLPPERKRSEDPSSERKRSEDPSSERRRFGDRVILERRISEWPPPGRKRSEDLPSERKRSEDLPPERKRSEVLPPERKRSEDLPSERRRSGAHLECNRSEHLPPERKRPRHSDIASNHNPCVSVDSDDDIVVIAGPSGSEVPGSKDSNSRNQSDSRTVEKNKKIDEPSSKIESQKSKNEISSTSHETPSKTILFSRKSTGSENNVVEIDLSESECVIPQTQSIRMLNEIPAASSSVATPEPPAEPPEFSFMITNVTSLAPEAFEGVQEQMEESNKVPTIESPRVLDEKGEGLTSQTAIVLDDEPLPVAPTSHVTDKSLHYSPTEIHDQMKIIRFDNQTDATGNPTNSIVYGITIPGTNQTLPLIFMSSENAGTNGLPAIPADLNKSSAFAGDSNTRSDSQQIRHANSSSIAPPTVVAMVQSPTKTPKSHRSVTNGRSTETPIAPKPNVNFVYGKRDNGCDSSLSLSVPLKTVVNGRFPGSRAMRKSMDGSNNKIAASNRGSSNATTPVAPKPLTADSLPTLPKGTFTMIPKTSMLMREPVGNQIPKTPTITPNASATKQLPSGPRLSEQPARPKTPVSSPLNLNDGSRAAKMFALLPPECQGQPKAISPSVPVSSASSNILKRKPNATTNGNYVNTPTTWLHSNGSVLKISTDAVNPNLNPLTQLHIQNTAANKPSNGEQQFYPYTRVDQTNAIVDDCDGDAGSGPAGQPASVYNPTNPRIRSNAASPCERDASTEVGQLPISALRTPSIDGCESDSDNASDSSASSDWSDSCDRTRLIYKSLNLRDLKFSISESNIVKMTVHDTYTVNMKVDSLNPCTNSKYSSLRTSKAALGREARPRNISRTDTTDVTILLSPAAGAVDDDAEVNQLESDSQENVSKLESASATNDSPGIDVASRGQDELKENLDPTPTATNTNHVATNVVDRKSKLRLHTCVNQSMRSLNENESQQMNSEMKSQNVLSDRKVDTVTKNVVPRSIVNDKISNEDSNQIHTSKRRRISTKNENPGEIQNFSPSTITKESRDCNDANINHLVNDTMNRKRKWEPSDDVSRPRKIHVNSTIDDRKSIAHDEPICFKVSIDLSRIRAVLAAKLNIFEKHMVNKSDQRYVRRKGFFVSKSALSRSKSTDNLTFDSSEQSNTELHRSWSTSDLSSSSSRSSVDNLGKNRKRGRKKKRRSFEEHDCVR